MVFVLVLLLALAVLFGGAPADGAPDRGLAMTLVVTLAKVVAFVVLTLVVGRRAVPWLLERVARLGSRELFTLAVLAVALGIAVGAAALFGVSVALGAFFAGMVVNSSPLSHEAARNALPLQDAFSVLFFVAVGMLFDPTIVIRAPLEVLAVLAIVVVGKSVGAFLIVRAFRYPGHTAFTISASLSQIGEFSFILAALAVSLNLMPREGQSLIVAGAIFSITLNPVAFWAASHAAHWLEPLPAPVEAARSTADIALHDHAIIVGYGRVGQAVGETFVAHHLLYVAIDQDQEHAEELLKHDVPVLVGDGARAELLELAGIHHARVLVVAVPDPYQARAIIERARELNPTIATIARAHSEEERIYLEQEGAGVALTEEHELAYGMAHHALTTMGCSLQCTPGLDEHI